MHTYNKFVFLKFLNFPYIEVIYYCLFVRREKKLNFEIKNQSSQQSSPEPDTYIQQLVET